MSKSLRQRFGPPHQPATPFYVALAGNIGVGKSMLTRLIGQTLGWRMHFEPVINNPYLDDFYADMRRWSFHLQVYFLSQRFTVHKAILDDQGSAVQDRTIYEDVEIFAPTLHRRGCMDQRDYENYREVFASMTAFLRPPDLILYLWCRPETALVAHPRARPQLREGDPARLPRRPARRLRGLDRARAGPLRRRAREHRGTGPAQRPRGPGPPADPHRRPPPREGRRRDHVNDRLLRLEPDWRRRVAAAVASLAQAGCRGRIGLVLGSGLGNVADGLSGGGAVSFADLRGFAAPTVPGHGGRVVWGESEGVPVVRASRDDCTPTRACPGPTS